MTARDFTPSHGYLILRQQGRRVGIWHLKDDCWHRKPFTESVSTAHAALRSARVASSKEPPNRAHPLLWVTLAGVWVAWLLT